MLIAQFTGYDDFKIAIPIAEENGAEALTIHYGQIEPVVGSQIIPMIWLVFEQTEMNL